MPLLRKTPKFFCVLKTTLLHICKILTDNLKYGSIEFSKTLINYGVWKPVHGKYRLQVIAAYSEGKLLKELVAKSLALFVKGFVWGKLPEEIVRAV